MRLSERPVYVIDFIVAYLQILVVNLFLLITIVLNAYKSCIQFGLGLKYTLLDSREQCQHGQEPAWSALFKIGTKNHNKDMLGGQCTDCIQNLPLTASVLSFGLRGH